MPRTEDYTMPRPYSLVAWRPAADMDPSPALVTVVSKRAISVVVFPPDSMGGMPRDGVRHVTDPVAARIAPDEGGIWDFTEDQKLLRVLVGEDRGDQGEAAKSFLNK